MASSTAPHGTSNDHVVITTTNFHHRVGKVPEVNKKGNGYPVPGEQNPSARMVMNESYFLDDGEWENILDTQEFDYIVVGSGFTALAFIEQALKLEPTKRILCLERGDFLLPSHFQNLPLPFKMTLGGPLETFPWTLSGETFKDPYLKFCRGSCPFFGGRSTFWSAWCPQPTTDDMRNFPQDMIGMTNEKDFWQEAKSLLNVTPANEIDDKIFADLQAQIDKRLAFSGEPPAPPVPPVPTATESYPAPLAVGHTGSVSTLRFNKFSTPGPLLKVYETQSKKHATKPENSSRLEIRLNCVVEKLTADENGMVRVIDVTSNGKKSQITWTGDNTRVILCAGAIPNATILLNSFPSCAATVGKRITGHFLSHIVARVPLSSFGPLKTEPDLEIAAHYLSGRDPQTTQQYHVQITAIHSPNPEKDADDAARECPDYAAAATVDQLLGSEEYVVFVCATLGEFSEHNEKNWLRLDPGNKDITTNVKLQYTLAGHDTQLWDVMDEATFKTIEKMAAADPKLEYWHVVGGSGEWKKERPPAADIRVPGIVHEASTAFVGEEKDGGSVDVDGRPHGIQNVHVTGGALFPAAGSWNPTLTICGFAQRLARQLLKVNRPY